MLLTQIKKDRMLANKEGNKQKYETLTTLLSEIQRLEKVDQEDDSKVQAVCKKYVKGIEEMIAVHMLKGIDDAVKPLDMPDILTKPTMEKKIVEEYLPKQMTEEELRKHIFDYAMALQIGGDLSKPIPIGEIMKHLKDNYNGQYDGKLASQLVKEILHL